MKDARDCEICGTSFQPRRSTDKTCSLECQIEHRRKLNREKARRHYKPRPAHPDVECQGCQTTIKVKAGKTPKWCAACRRDREDVRARARQVAGRRNCHKCGVPVPEAIGKPGITVCGACRQDRRTEVGRRVRQVRERLRTLRRYGLTPEAFDELLTAQAGRCRTCRTDDPGPKGWCIDHCHSSGHVRALLCSRCNTALGWVNEDPVILRALADFAEEWQQVLASEMKI